VTNLHLCANSIWQSTLQPKEPIVTKTAQIASPLVHQLGTSTVATCTNQGNTSARATLLRRFKNPAGDARAFTRIEERRSQDRSHSRDCAPHPHAIALIVGAAGFFTHHHGAEAA
jgi:hypothetical protein